MGEPLEWMSRNGESLAGALFYQYRVVGDETTPFEVEVCVPTESLMGVSMMILFPLTFVSNVFVDPETMRGWLETFVDVNPFSHLVIAMRGLMHGRATSDEVALVLGMSAGLLAVFASVTM